jgi:hypothetical protein
MRTRVFQIGAMLSGHLGLLFDRVGALYYRVKSALIWSNIYQAKPDLNQLLQDPLVNAELRQAWYESRPHAPEVGRGNPGSRKHEQGGFIYWNRRTNRLEIQRVSAGRRDGLADLPPVPPPGREMVGSFHTHPNTLAEGYGSDPSPADRNFTRNLSKVPEIIETHDGRKTIPYP